MKPQKFVEAERTEVFLHVSGYDKNKWTTSCGWVKGLLGSTFFQSVRINSKQVSLKKVWLRYLLWSSASLLPSSFLCLSFCDLCAGFCLGFMDPADPNWHQGHSSLAKETRSSQCTESLRNTDRVNKRPHTCRRPLTASEVILRATRLPQPAN